MNKNVKICYLKAEYGLEMKILMGKFYFTFIWDKIVNLHVCICKNKTCIWSDPGVDLPICKYTPVSICVHMRHLLEIKILMGKFYFAFGRMGHNSEFTRGYL